MSSWKLTLVLCGIAGFSFIALGGPQQVMEMFPQIPDAIAMVLLSGTPFQTTVAVLSLLLVSIGLMPRSDQNFSRGEFLQAVSLGCAIVVSACLALAIHFASGSGPTLPGIVTSVAILQATVGLCAAALLIVDRETRPLASLPMIANGALCAITVIFTLGPVA